MDRKRAYLIAAMFSAAFLLCGLPANAISAGDDQPASRDRQDIWCDEDRLEKNAVVQALSYRVVRPATDYDAAYRASSSAICELILLFDGRGDSGAMRTLVELTSYRLDGAAREILACVILRKGQAILPALEARIATGDSDCMVAMGINERACLSADRYGSEMQSYIRLKEADSPCYIEH